MVSMESSDIMANVENIPDQPQVPPVIIFKPAG
jgi:hypothetical protein